MKGKRHCIRILILGAVTCICYFTGIQDLRTLNEGTRTVTLISGGEQAGMDYESAKTAQEENEAKEDPMNFVTWGQNTKALISNKELGRQQEADILTAYGRTDLLFPGCAALDKKSTECCLISSELSVRLFGSSDTVGLYVSYQEELLEIIGIVKNQSPLLVRQINAEEVTVLDRATIGILNGGNPYQSIKTYQQSYGNWKLLDYNILSNITSALYLMVPFILGIFLLYTIKKYIDEAKQRRRERIIWYFILFITLVIFLWMLAKQISLPNDMIPDKWSDFGFWGQYWKKKKEAILLLIKTSKKMPEIQNVITFYKAFIKGGIAIIGETLVLIRGVRHP